ncbi:hypothetical protein BOTCAL_0082g00140 [Botryotinia calthae]|uniref:Uncharacterized protein n=1 Tax=Botryotinia calthae TaxID=38488 RepID=A0A4Y8DAB0_9HELO|nr:hypothetical protein BOTCAL_0082g00140 [Botryotinia calthae]
MSSRNFDATMSFRTMYNDSRGMKTVDFSPASEEANPLFDKNGGSLSKVMVARRTFVCKIGWLKRTEEKERVYLKVQNCLPYPIRPEGMEDEKWEEVRSKGPESRVEWVLKAIEALREDKLWESLPIEKFKDRHYEVREVAGKKRDTIQAKYLDNIMYDVGLALYCKRKGEPKQIWNRHGGRGY